MVRYSHFGIGVMFRVVLSAAVAALVSLPALGADPDAMGFAHIGVSYGQQADDATMYVLGAAVPGAGFSTEGQASLALEAGLFLRDGFAIAASGMLPGTTPNLGSGTISALGNLGDETVGFYSVTAQYHFNLGAFSPYFGGGAGYMHVFGTKDGVVRDMRIASALGGVLQAGFDVALTDNFGVFIDFKQYFLSTSASGTLGGAPIAADARVDPWVVSSGLSMKF